MYKNPTIKINKTQITPLKVSTIRQNFHTKENIRDSLKIPSKVSGQKDSSQTINAREKAMQELLLSPISIKLRDMSIEGRNGSIINYSGSSKVSNMNTKKIFFVRSVITIE